MLFPTLLGGRLRLFLGFIAFVCLATNANADLYAFDTAKFEIGGKQLKVELAQTPVQRSRGLMWREHLDEDAGMLFVFNNAEPLCFWMRNTLVPLSIGFFDAEFVLMQVTDMHPLSDQIHCSDRPAQYALEVNQGWFERQQIRAQDQPRGRIILDQDSSPDKD